MIEKRHTFVISDDEKGQRLDQLLTTRFQRFSRSDWQERIRAGRVTVGGVPARPSKRTRAGEVISFTFLQRPEPEVDRNYSIVFRDDWLLVLNKPPNLPVHPSGVYNKHTLLTFQQARPRNKRHYARGLSRRISCCPPARAEKRFVPQRVRRHC
ncbi:MAG: hypothetical protein HY042_04280 [Spirochaetia bacterium]|nr:hypothetical protein [Spirochaetia bacterium]